MTKILKFWAPWCNPCKALTPIMHDAIYEAKADVELVEINIEDDGADELCTQYGVRNIPTVVKVVDNKEVARFVGTKTKEEIIDFINS